MLDYVLKASVDVKLTNVRHRNVVNFSTKGLSFIAGQIGFVQMAEVVEAVLSHQIVNANLKESPDTLDRVIEMDELARRQAAEIIANA